LGTPLITTGYTSQRNEEIRYRSADEDKTEGEVIKEEEKTRKRQKESK
jgi:hypothetical protein